jgi:DNA-binding NtrC family response regulator
MGLITWIEDTPRYVDPFIDEFKDAGHSVNVVHDCNSVLKQLHDSIVKSDIVVLDLWLPVGAGSLVPHRYASNTSLRGVWLYSQIRDAAEKLHRSLPIVIMSGNLDVDTWEKLISQGIDESLLWKKPVQFDSFVDFISELLGE